MTVFFNGFLSEPGRAALGMLACAAIAQARYHLPFSGLSLADPVVTSNGDRLRFESSSGCCGVHARFRPAAVGAPSSARCRCPSAG
jgi:hypothetical protein